MNIRNFSIIAHIDHGKSTLADRILEITNTIDKRKMQDQILDSMELERERGITIKLTPVRINYKSKSGENFILNLIDTPGHIDFSYEVSRSLKAVEGVLLLVDATQGVQAQTISVLDMAREQSLRIIPVLNKIDSPLANIDKTEDEIIQLINCKREDIMRVSGKTGEGVLVLLEHLVNILPAPIINSSNKSRAMLFDFEYSNHQGVVVYARVFDGIIKKGDDLKFIASNKSFTVKEIGIFSPDKQEREYLSAGEIGYIVTGLKEPGVAVVGDTITNRLGGAEALPGYQLPVPIVFASVYPEYQEYFDDLRTAFGKLKLSDSSLGYEEETSGILGRGFRCGFLGMLHLEIVTERLRREYNIDLIVTMPSVTYKVVDKNGKEELIYTPIHFPDYGNILKIYEP
ncbi:MAG: translation elongation factor 4 [Cyanobium sp. MAG06]|nr:translation elongation factor 4 [Cyanobium sp. MAG06]